MCRQERGLWSMCGGHSTTCRNLLSPSTLWISEIDFTSGLGQAPLTAEAFCRLQVTIWDCFCFLQLFFFSFFYLFLFVSLFVSFLPSVFSQNTVHLQDGMRTRTSWSKQPLFFLHGYREALLTSLSTGNLGYLSRFSALCWFPCCNLGKCSAQLISEDFKDIFPVHSESVWFVVEYCLSTYKAWTHQ